MTVVAAGLQSYGEPEMSEYIFGRLPLEPLRCGYCNRFAVRLTKAVLPLPAELRECA